MKNFKIVFLLSISVLFSLVSYSQEQTLTDIQKNLNEQASGLEQHLNSSLDTLTLTSDKRILRVTFLSHDEKDSIIIDVDAPEIKIPLYHFKKGRYTIAVYREDKIIALGVKRLEDIPRPVDAIADLEESILRSSLSDEELLDRNIEPLNNKPDTRLAEANRKPKESQGFVRKAKAKAKNTARTKPKPKPKKERVKKAPKKRDTRVASNSNQKSAFEKAAKREEAEKIAKEKAARDKNALAARDKSKRQKKPTTLIQVKKVTYNLTSSKKDGDNRQTREEYRATNLRPNGLPYD